VAVRSQDLEVLAQVAVDGRRFGRRFYDQQFDEEALALTFVIFY